MCLTVDVHVVAEKAGRLFGIVNVDTGRCFGFLQRFVIVNGFFECLSQLHRFRKDVELCLSSGFGDHGFR